ncbi:MAG: T9SS type A sorting domain-containing protein [Flavobacteriia bacterium]|nr:T9SS type A sorting domain-containing protein [Flavobacteriia bacterium]
MLSQFDLGSQLKWILILVLSTIAFYSSTAQQCNVSNVTFFNQTATTVSVTWQDTVGGQGLVEWGHCGFTQGTGQYATSTNDTAVITGIVPGAKIDVYIQARSGPPSATFYCHVGIYIHGCFGVGDDFSNPNPLTFPAPQSSQPVSIVRSPISSSVGCYTNQYSAKPGIDAVYRYLPSGLANTLDIYAPPATDAQSIIILDSSQTVVHTSSTGVAPNFGAQVSGFTVNPNMTYYIVLELDSIKLDSCAYSNVSFIEAQSPCVRVASTQLLSRDCHEIALSWNLGSSDSVYVEYGSQGYAPGNGQSLGWYTSTNATAQSLSPGTVYDFYIKSNCGSSLSGWQGPFTHNTLGSSSPAQASFQYSLDSLDQSAQYFTFDGSASTADSLFWYFDDNTPIETGNIVQHAYTAYGTYNVICVAVQRCTVDSIVSQVLVQPQLLSEVRLNELTVYPSPASDHITVEISEKVMGVSFTTMSGQKMGYENWQESDSGIQLNTSQLPVGVYVLTVLTNQNTYQQSVVIDR